MRTSEKWGVDVDTAIDLALKELKLTRDEVEIEILEESSNGFMSTDSKLARVKVTEKEDRHEKNVDMIDDIDKILAELPENRAIEVPDEIREEYGKYEQEEMEDARAYERQKAKERKKEKNRSKRRKRENLSIENTLLFEFKNFESVENHPVELFLREITKEMGIDLDFDLKVKDNIVFVNITGKDTRTIIGKRGQTLDAVQYLASLVANKDREDYVRVILDAENYRAKREKTLIDLAKRLAEKVIRSNRSITLEPMNPYERKVIHSTLQDNPKVKTRSEGKDPYRKVIIEKK